MLVFAQNDVKSQRFVRVRVQIMKRTNNIFELASNETVSGWKNRLHPSRSAIDEENDLRHHEFWKIQLKGRLFWTGFESLLPDSIRFERF